MEVTRVEADGFLSGDGVAEIKFMRSGDVAFRANAEKFSFDGVDLVPLGEFLREDLPLVEAREGADREQEEGGEAAHGSINGHLLAFWRVRTSPGLLCL